MNPLHRVSSFIASLKVELTRLSGISRTGGEQVTIVCGVGNKTFHYLAGLMFEPGYQAELIGSAWLWNAARKARRSTPDALLLFIESGGRKLRFFGDSWIRIPIWVRSEIPIPVPDTLRKRETYKTDFRKLREAGFHYEVTRDPVQMDDFYHNMYKPYIASSHGGSAILKEKDKLLSEFGDPELLLVKEGQSPVAGILLSHEYEIPKMYALGIKDGNLEYLSRGALFACYHFTLEYLAGAGYRTVNAGSSKGFIRDGVMNFKRKFGHRLTEPQEYYLLLTPLRHSRQTTALLCEQPVICELNGTLHSLVFVDEDRLAKLQSSSKERRRYFIPGSRSLLACNPESPSERFKPRFITVEGRQ